MYIQPTRGYFFHDIYKRREWVNADDTRFDGYPKPTNNSPRYSVHQDEFSLRQLAGHAVAKFVGLGTIARQFITNSLAAHA